MTSSKLKILFLCTGNSCRSQMAEGWARTLLSEKMSASSAGVEAHGLNPDAVLVMQEAGVDISQQESQTVDQLPDREFDAVVTVCDNARERCPAWIGQASHVLHVSFDDPPRLAASAASREEALGHYRRVRDEVKAFIETLPETLGAK